MTSTGELLINLTSNIAVNTKMPSNNTASEIL